MSSVLIADQQGIPVHYFNIAQYQLWLAEQDDYSQNWLKHSGFSGEGLALLPSSSGELARVIFVSAAPEEYFAAGDVIGQLPARQYLLQCAPEYAMAFAFAWTVGSYKFSRYQAKTAELPVLACSDAELVTQVNKLANAVTLTRDLVNTPASDMMPEHLADTMATLADNYGASMQQLVGEQLLEQNYPTIYAVGRASVHQPRLLDMTWGDDSHPKVTLVGKGVCFDSGGLDIKPSSGMRLMKKDMGGAAHVLGLAQLIMAHKLPVRLRVLIPAVENAISSNAMRPGDVITTRKGLTVEIDNTDAEGRLVLCDALAEAETEQPELLIDFATLTGAMRVALGTELPGFFASNEQTAEQLYRAGLAVCDPVWRLPLHQPYKSLLKSEIADLSNCPSVPQGGAITAALYLQAFVNPGTDWLHFDVMAWNSRKLSGRPVGGEAFGIRAVFAYLQQRYQG